jgi:hypothetical protein
MNENNIKVERNAGQKKLTRIEYLKLETQSQASQEKN